MSRRRAPRPAHTALRSARESAAPKTGLAALQSVWAELVGERIAAVAQPVSERGGDGDDRVAQTPSGRRSWT